MKLTDLDKIKQKREYAIRIFRLYSQLGDMKYFSEKYNYKFQTIRLFFTDKYRLFKYETAKQISSDLENFIKTRINKT